MRLTVPLPESFRTQHGGFLWLGMMLLFAGFNLSLIQVTESIDARRTGRIHAANLAALREFAMLRSLLRETDEYEDSVGVEMACTRLKSRLHHWSRNNVFDGTFDTRLRQLAAYCDGDGSLLPQGRNHRPARRGKTHNLEEAIDEVQRYWLQSTQYQEEELPPAGKLLGTMVRYPYFPLVLTALGIAMLLLSVSTYSVTFDTEQMRWIRRRKYDAPENNEA